MAPARKFSANDRTSQLIPAEVEIGDRVFKVKRTGKALRKIVELTPDDESAQDPANNIGALYEGLSFILIDGDGQNADPEFLENELDFEVAQELMSTFLPSTEVPTAAAPAATNQSTPDTVAPA